MRMNNNIKKIILFFGDIIILYLSLYLTLFIRYFSLPSRANWQSHFWPFSITFIAWILIFYISDLYNLHLAVNNSKFFNLTFRSVFISSLVSATYFYADPHISIAPKTNLLIFLILSALLIFFWRRIFNWSLNTYLPKTNIAFIGYNGQVKALIKALREKPHLGFRVALVAHSSTTDMLPNIPATSDFKNLEKEIHDKKISTIILASDPYGSPELRASLFACLPQKLNFIRLANFYESITGRIPLEAINQMWFLENLNEGRKITFDSIKRTYDLILASLILIITAIFWPLIGIIIKLESPGPIFFKQKRIGRHNQKFTIIKFRTMGVANNSYAPTQKNDIRVTRIGKFLRKTRIDELPQILNIIFGDMSFVGPRPERPELIIDLEKDVPFYRERMLVKPGLTGWDQVSGEYHSPSREDTIKKLQYDLFYIKNRSLYLDAAIILKTIATVLKSNGR